MTKQYYFVVDMQSGKAHGLVDLPAEDFAADYPLGEGQQLIWFDPELGSPDDFETALVGGEIVLQPRAVDPARDLAVAQLNHWEAVKAIREAKIAGGVTVSGIGRFDSSQEARENVAGAAGAALTAIVMGTPEAFSAEWTLADNSPRTMTAQEMVQVQLAGVAYIDAVHARARELRGLIDAATTLADLEAIDVESEWPT